MEDWLLFFLSGVLTEARDASRRAGRLFDLRETYRERFQREGGRINLLAAIDHLFARPSRTSASSKALWASPLKPLEGS